MSYPEQEIHLRFYGTQTRACGYEGPAQTTLDARVMADLHACSRCGEYVMHGVGPRQHAITGVDPPRVELDVEALAKEWVRDEVGLSRENPIESGAFEAQLMESLVALLRRVVDR